MHPERALQAGIEYAPRAGHSVGRPFGLFGCLVKAADVDACRRLLPDNVRAHLNWIEGHSPAEISIEVTELLPGAAAMGSGSWVATFAWDYLPAAPEDLLAAFEQLERSRREVLRLLTGVDPLLLPTGSRRTIKEIIQHIAAVERWYATNVSEVPELPRADSLEERLRLTRALFRDTMQTLIHTDPARVVHFRREDWTPRKALRRACEHEMEHLDELARLLGKPAPYRVDYTMKQA